LWLALLSLLFFFFRARGGGIINSVIEVWRTLKTGIIVALSCLPGSRVTTRPERGTPRRGRAARVGDFPPPSSAGGERAENPYCSVQSGKKGGAFVMHDILSPTRGRTVWDQPEIKRRSKLSDRTGLSIDAGLWQFRFEGRDLRVTSIC